MNVTHVAGWHWDGVLYVCSTYVEEVKSHRQGPRVVFITRRLKTSKINDM
jgi:hypothetical protein